jgi:rubrerythrin
MRRLYAVEFSPLGVPHRCSQHKVTAPDDASTCPAEEDTGKHMNRTYKREEKIVEEFARRRCNQIMVNILVLAGFLALGIGTQSEGTLLLNIPPAIWLPTGVSLLVVGVLYGIRNWRCPACDRSLGKHHNPKYCPHCGARLR